MAFKKKEEEKPKKPMAKTVAVPLSEERPPVGHYRIPSLGQRVMADYKKRKEENK